MPLFDYIDPITQTNAADVQEDLKKSRRRRAARNGESSLLPDRLPPHSIETEQGLLGCILISPAEVMADCIGQGCSPDWFYDLRHQTIFGQCISMFDALEPIDTITLMQRLKDRQLLEQIGGIVYLSSLPDMTPSAANASFYVGVLRDKFLLRSMIRVCTEVVGRIYDFKGDVPALVDEVERDILRVGESRATTEIVPTKEVVQRAIVEIENSVTKTGVLSGLSTGYPDLDKMTDGLQGGEMIVIAARPSMGKTSLAMNIAENVCVNGKFPVGVFSMEMTNTQLIKRMISSRGRVNLRNIRDGFVSERDFPRLVNAARKISVAPLYIDDTPSLSILQMRAKARRMFQQFKIRLFVVDYLQLMNASGTVRRNENRQQEISYISAGVKAIAKELAVPVIVLSQLNRDIEREKNRKPRLSDLRESGAIEQDADTIGFLYKPKMSSEDDEDRADAVATNLLIAKSRNGPTGDIYLTFLKTWTRFESAAKVSDEDIPQKQMEY